jgi:hypothetical protein
LVLRSDVAEVKFHPGSAWFGPRRNERVLIEISLVRELDDTGAVLQGELFLGSKYVQDVPRNVKQRLRGKGWLARRKRAWPDKGS